MVLSFARFACARSPLEGRRDRSFRLCALHVLSSLCDSKEKNRVVAVYNVVLLDTLLLRVRLGRCCTGLYHGFILGNKFSSSLDETEIFLRTL